VPRSSRSPQLTDAYRARLASIRQRTEQAAQRDWPTIDRLDTTAWAGRAAAVLAGAQTEAVRATAGFLTAYLSTELGRRVRAVMIDSRAYAGLSRDGRPLTESLQSPLIAVRAALKDGKPPPEALQAGLVRARRMVEMDLMHAARRSLLDAIDADDRITGWQRATAGTCGACMALSGTSGVQFAVHPGCQCVPAPTVRGVRNLVPILTGIEIFRRMSREEQDEQFGPEKAEALRAGEITLDELVSRSPLATDQPDFITEKPLDAAL